MDPTTVGACCLAAFGLVILRVHFQMRKLVKERGIGSTTRRVLWRNWKRMLYSLAALLALFCLTQFFPHIAWIWPILVGLMAAFLFIFGIYSVCRKEQPAA